MRYGYPKIGVRTLTAQMLMAAQGDDRNFERELLARLPRMVLNDHYPRTVKYVKEVLGIIDEEECVYASPVPESCFRTISLIDLAQGRVAAGACRDKFVLFGPMGKGEDVHPFVTPLRPGKTEIHGVYVHLFALVQLLKYEAAIR